MDDDGVGAGGGGVSGSDRQVWGGVRGEDARRQGVDLLWVVVLCVQGYHLCNIKSASVVMVTTVYSS